MDKIFLFFYNFLWLAPFILLLCICLGRKDERLLKRLTLRLPKGLAGDGVLWVHALSVGEVISAVPLVKRLRQTYPR